jgi:ribosome maturation factor RimP
MHGSSRQGSRPSAIRGGTGPRALPLPDADRLTRLLEPVITAMNMDLESIRVTAVGRRRLLRVVVDADGGVSLDDIALASRELSVKLDPVMGELPYTLEVSSPGVDRPLTQPRHWRRAVGRLVVAPLADGVAEGRITRCTDRGVTLERDGRTSEYSYAELGPGRVQVEFGHFDLDLDLDDGQED